VPDRYLRRADWTTQADMASRDSVPRQPLDVFLGTALFSVCWHNVVPSVAIKFLLLAKIATQHLVPVWDLDFAILLI